MYHIDSTWMRSQSERWYAATQWATITRQNPCPYTPPYGTPPIGPPPAANTKWITNMPPSFPNIPISSSRAAPSIPSSKCLPQAAWRKTLSWRAPTTPSSRRSGARRWESFDRNICTIRIATTHSDTLYRCRSVMLFRRKSDGLKKRGDWSLVLIGTGQVGSAIFRLIRALTIRLICKIWRICVDWIVMIHYFSLSFVFVVWYEEKTLTLFIELIKCLSVSRKLNEVFIYLLIQPRHLYHFRQYIYTKQ